MILTKLISFRVRFSVKKMFKAVHANKRVLNSQMDVIQNLQQVR